MIFTQKSTAVTEEMEIIAEEVVEDLVEEVATEEETATAVAVSTVVEDHLHVVDRWGESFLGFLKLSPFVIFRIIIQVPAYLHFYFTRFQNLSRYSSFNIHTIKARHQIV